jgi:hypothetical protein
MAAGRAPLARHAALPRPRDRPDEYGRVDDKLLIKPAGARTLMRAAMFARSNSAHPNTFKHLLRCTGLTTERAATPG